MPMSSRSRRADPFRDPGLAAYMAEAVKLPLLKREEERELLARAKAGDRAAANKLVTGNLRFVVAVCWNYRNRGLPLADLISEGNLALYQAIAHFERPGIRFISYAVWWVRQAALSALARQAGAVGFPPDRMFKALRFKRVENVLSQRLGRFPNTQEIAAALGAGPRTSASIEKVLQGLSSRRDGYTPATETMEALPAAPDETDSEAGAARYLDLKFVQNILAKLSERDQRILRLRFGIGSGVRFSLSEIGAAMGLTRERVRQIESRILAALRSTLCGSGS